MFIYFERRPLEYLVNGVIRCAQGPGDTKMAIEVSVEKRLSALGIIIPTQSPRAANLNDEWMLAFTKRPALSVGRPEEGFTFLTLF